MSFTLQADDAIKATDWFAEANEAEDVLNNYARLSKVEIREALGLPSFAQWAVLPGSEPGVRRPFLMTLVDEGLDHNVSDKAVRAILERRLEQALIYTTRISPSTQGILFVLVRSHFTWGGGWRSPAHLHWRELWCRYRSILLQDRPDLKLRVMFFNRVREGRRVCHFYRDGSPAGGRLLLNWWQTASEPARALLSQRICLLRHLGIEPDLDCRFYEQIGSDQPDGCNYVPALDFGATLRPGQADPGLVARLYLTPELDLPIAFPESRYNEAHRMEILSGPKFAAIAEPLWRPADMALFSSDPGLWLARGPAFF